MDFKTYLISYFIALLSLSVMFGIIYTDHFTVSHEEVKPINRYVLLVYDKTTNKVFITDYLIYKIEYIDPQLYTLEAKIIYKCENLSFSGIPLKNIIIKASPSESYPIIPPKKIMSFADYYSLIEGKYSFSILSEGLKNYSGIFHRVVNGYLLVIIKYYVDSLVLIDVTKYVPPAIYYPNQPPTTDLLINMVVEASNNDLYAVTLIYAFRTIINDNTEIIIYLNHILSAKNLHLDYLAYSWIILFILIEIYEPRAIVIFAKTLFYRSRALPSRIIRMLRKLKQYIGELSRI